MPFFGRLFPYSFNGKSALVTGGSRGLGLILARMLAERGADVAICARDSDALARAEEDLRARRKGDGRIFAMVADVTDRKQARAFVEATVAQFGTLHVIINNAGVIQAGPFDAFEAEDFDLSLRTHFWAPYFILNAALPFLREHPRQARILNVTSVGGKIPVPHLLPYSSGKFALVGFSEGLRAELAAEGIPVTTAVPGLMRTGSVRNALFAGRGEAEKSWFSALAALPLLSMDAERAATRILQATARGQAELILTLPAWIAVKVWNLAPALSQWLLGWTARTLPHRPRPMEQGSEGRVRAGHEVHSPVDETSIGAVHHAAARAHNELAG